MEVGVGSITSFMLVLLILDRDRSADLALTLCSDRPRGGRGAMHDDQYMSNGTGGRWGSTAERDAGGSWGQASRDADGGWGGGGGRRAFSPARQRGDRTNR